MKLLYAACLSRLGLSQAEAAALHGDINVSTVKQWASGRRIPPPGVWDELREYEARIVDRSEELREQWEDAGSPPIEIDDSEADSAAIMAVADFVLGTEPGTPVHVGSTDATRMAHQARRLN